VFPAWSRWLLPPAQALLGAAVTLIAVRIAERLRHPVIAFCLLGGLWGSVAHVWAVYRGIMTKPPMLRGASPAAAVIFASFEFTLYYCLITLAALAASRARSRRTG
jgi:hypothetical protein